jgi:hypothetical protein
VIARNGILTLDSTNILRAPEIGPTAAASMTTIQCSELLPAACFRYYESASESP